MFNRKKKEQKLIAEKELGGIRLRITDRSATFESLSKDWKIMYGIGTQPYMIIIQLYNAGELKTLEGIGRLLYMQECFFYAIKDEKFKSGFARLGDAIKSVLKQIEKENPKVEITKEEDDEILRQEQLKHDNNGRN